MENIETLLAAVAQTQGFDDDDEPVVRTPSEVGLDNSEAPPVIRGDTSASQVIGDVRPSAVVDKLLPATTSFAAVGRVIGDGEKRKRGRPPKGQLAAKPPPPKRTKVEDEEEDVCFICFDGGSLVLCDRKGCPKAYHPACIKRDEAFFKSTARWNCGWHICSVCQKASHYMCYTCTYSLCKRCTTDTDFLLVRGNKGFCSTCMKMIMMIENKDQATNESVKVDFDDKFSWEYLFKMYWVLLKEKLSLTLTELMQAKNPWNGVTAVAFKLQLSNVHTAVSREVSTSCRSTVQLELNKPHVEINLIQNDGLKTEPSSHDNHVEKQNSEKGEHISTYKEDSGKPNRHKVTDETIIDRATNEPAVEVATKEPCIVKDQNDSSIVKDTDKPLICKNTTEEESDKPGIDSGQWASEELLEFVAHMKNGDTSPVSQFDAQTLLLNYIKRHNLRDPHRKSQIICDLRLKNLFGKPRVGHIEMLKLLEFHFLIKEDSQKSSFIPAGFVSSVSSDVEVDATPINSRKRRTRKKSEDKPPQNDLCGYAAIDVHNINMIYLRRNLMENLIGDHGNLKDKVIGSIVRIRISTNDQKPEVFRLVQVVGTSKAAEPYTIGDRTTDVMLEVLNLDKKEVVSIDAISNLEFTEDECRRLRQSIRCGLVKLFTVGEVQKKALALQSVRVNDWLEAEVMRLNHLRDRASEKGRKKELREYVDRIELLKSSEERQRRFSAVPEIHVDPKMDPDYVSEEDTRVGDNDIRDENMKPSYSPYPRRGRERTSPNKKGKKEQSAEAHSRTIEKTGVSGSNRLDKHMNQINIDSGRNDQVMQRPGLEASTATASTGNSPSSDNIETEKLWHYRDPNGRIQGPFAMMQLRKWSTTGLFPPDMRIWTNHEQYDSLLLTDALKGKLHGAPDLSYKPCLDSLENGATGEIGVHESTNGISGDDKQTEAARPDSVGVSSDKNTGRPGADESGSSGWPQCWDLLKDSNSSADDVQERNLFPASGSGERNVALTDRGQGERGQGEKNSTELTQNAVTSVRELQNRTRNNDQVGPPCEEKLRSIIIDLGLNDMDSGPVSPPQPESRSPDSSKQAETNAAFTDRCYGEKNLTELTQNTVTSAPELQDRTRNNDRAGPPCEESLRAIIIDLGLNDMDSSPVSPPQPVSRSPDSIKQAEDPPCEENLSIEVDSGLNKMDSRPVSPPALRLPDLSKQSENIEVLDLPSPTPKTVAQQAVSADAPVQDTCILELLSPTRRPNNEYQQEDQATENRQSGFAIFPNSGPGWTTTSTLGISVQLPEVADEWCGFSPTPARPSTQEWDTGHVSASSSKPPEVMSENINLQPASTTPNWLTIMNEPIEFDALGEESISDLLAEVDAMESQQALPSPTSAIKFARELMEDCKDDCFSSIEEFSSAPGPRKSDAFSSTTDLQQTSQSSAQCNTSPVDAFDFFKRSSAHSSASSEGETNAPVHSGEAGSEFHPPTSNNTGQDMIGPAMGSSPTDPGWGSVQGNINMVTVQGNVNLVLGGPTQGMANLGWGTNPGTGWASPNVSRSPRGGSLPWDGQRKYNGERFTSPREWGYQGRQPWGRQPYGGGGYSRPLPKGQRVCKFYESGRCKKGAFCDYLHQ